MAKVIIAHISFAKSIECGIMFFHRVTKGRNLFLHKYKVSNMLEYSEYKSLVDIIEKSQNHENTYEEVMKKEEKVLDTMNRVIKYYRDVDIKENQFVNIPVSKAVYRFFNVWLDIYNDLMDANTTKGVDIVSVFTKDDRLVYIGVMLVLLSVFLYYVEITRSVVTHGVEMVK